MKWRLLPPLTIPGLPYTAVKNWENIEIISSYWIENNYAPFAPQKQVYVDTLRCCHLLSKRLNCLVEQISVSQNTGSGIT